MSPEQVEELGNSLAACRRHGSIAPLRLDRIGSVAEAQAVQTAAVEAYGGDPAGYSVQATTALSRRLLGCGDPICGPLLDTDLLPDGATFRLPPGIIGSGCVLSFLFARPYPADGETVARETVSQAIAVCRLGIEILGRRVPGSVPLNAYTAAADFALSVVHVQGPAIPRWHERDLSATEVAARLNGETLARSPCGHALDAAAWLADALVRRDGQIEAGEIVATGTCTGILQILPGQTFEAIFPGGGTVGIDLT